MPAPPCGNYGDISGNGDVTRVDATIVENYVNGYGVLTPEQLVLADVDGDGVVTRADAALIADYAVGNIDTFPVCTAADDCPWDLNGDGVVDEKDQEIFSAAYDSRPGDSNWDPACDFNKDGVVDLLDATIFSWKMGPCPGSGRVVTINIPSGATLKVDGVEIL